MRGICLGVCLVVLIASCGRAPETKSEPVDQAKAEALDPAFTKEVLHSKVPVLVDFWAPWCGPCRLIGPIVEELGEEYKGKVKVVKINVDDAQEISEFYAIESIPTLIVYKNGKVHQRMVGVPAGDTKKALTSWLDKAIQ